MDSLKSEGEFVYFTCFPFFCMVANICTCSVLTCPYLPLHSPSITNPWSLNTCIYPIHKSLAHSPQYTNPWSLPLGLEGQGLGEEEGGVIRREVGVLKESVAGEALATKLLVVLSRDPRSKLAGRYLCECCN